MAIDYTKYADETVDAYNARIAQARALKSSPPLTPTPSPIGDPPNPYLAPGAYLTKDGASGPTKENPNGSIPAPTPFTGLPNAFDRPGSPLAGNQGNQFYLQNASPTASIDYTKSANETTQQYYDRVAKARSITPTPTIPATSSISTSTPPTLPTPSAPKAFNDYFASAATQVDGYKKSLGDMYKTQISSIQTQKDNAQAQIDAATTGEKGALDNIDTLTAPFRANLETSERDRLGIEKNYQANQGLIDQLQTLLTDANAQEQNAENVTGLAAIRNPRIAQAKNELAGKVGVIQAVLAARNDQISVGEHLIDRSVAAITADRQDQLGYYKTLLDYYGNEKSTAQGNLSKLDSDQKKYIDAQIGQAQSDLDNAQKNADYIKQLLIDPSTALLAAQAGVSVTDDVATINQKLAKATYAKEVSGIVNDAAAKGYQRVYAPQANAIEYTDSKGQKYYFINPSAKNGGGGGSSTTPPSETGTGAQFAKFKFTQKQLGDMNAKGLSPEYANQLLDEIKQGYTLDDIRQQMRDSHLDPGFLDTIMYYVDPAHNTPPKAEPKSSAGRSL